MSAIVSGLEGVLCLMDDVLVFRRDEDEYHRRLTTELTKIQSAGITLNPEKCEFAMKSVKFLGHIVNGVGITAAPDKITAIVDMAAPKDVSDHRRFLGITIK